MRQQFNELKGTSVDNLMYIVSRAAIGHDAKAEEYLQKEDLIIPHVRLHPSILAA